MRLLALSVVSFAVFGPLSAAAQETSDSVRAVIEELVVANRILANEGILPGYGHISVRHPEDPSRYFLSRSRAPELVTAEDIVEFDLDSVPVGSRHDAFYLERFIHGEVYKARPDVMSVVHNHSPTVISFGIGATPLRPVFHQAAFFLDGIPIWDYRDFGTDGGALVNNPARGAGLAEALGDRPVVLMKNHGVVVVGNSIRMATGRSITLELNAEMQSLALSRGEEITYLELDEESQGGASDRAWQAWERRLSGDR